MSDEKTISIHPNGVQWTLDHSSSSTHNSSDHVFMALYTGGTVICRKKVLPQQSVVTKSDEKTIPIHSIGVQWRLDHSGSPKPNSSDHVFMALYTEGPVVFKKKVLPQTLATKLETCNSSKCLCML